MAIKHIDLETLLTRLQNIEKLPEEEINKLSWDTVNGICAESGVPHRAFFVSEKLKSAIVDFSTNHCINNYVLRNLIIIMGMTAKRFEEYDERYYQFILSTINNTDNDLKKQIRRFIWLYPQFKNYNNRWEYMASISKIPPKKESIETLMIWVNLDRENIVNVKDMPDVFINVVLKVLDEFLKKNKAWLGEVGNDYYEKAIAKLQMKLGQAK
ncbi:MAG: hypothetical protein FWG66_13785 [Spirochaetes bacterium]|nr:hypothetical protein [Spirochaetota bacterium]